jgi:hypothetical protein
MQNNKLEQRLAQLPEQMAPTTELWPALAARLPNTVQQNPIAEADKREPATTGSGWWYGMAAALLLSVLGWWQFPAVQQQVALQPELAALPVAASPMPAATSDHKAGGADLGRAEWQLISLFETDKARLLQQLTLVPAEYGDWQQQLAIWQQASRQIQQALTYQPDQPVLLRQLQRVQQQQLAYIQKLVQSDLSEPGAYL